MKTHAKVVIIGGGIVGTSTLYHLCEMGLTDAMLIELNELTSGSTWHAAGNIPTYSTSRNIIKLQHYSTQLYDKLGAKVDYPINYHQTGSIRIARNESRRQEFEHVYSMARAMGIEYEMMSHADMQERLPFLNTDDVVTGLWDPYDGDIDPSQVTQALAKGARAHGAEINRFTRVTAIQQLSNGQWEITTDKGTVTCEVVVNAGGYRSQEIAAMIGQYLPMVTMQHQYLVTESIPELEALDAPIPLLRDPDDSYYLRQEGNGLILGPYEWKATPHWSDGKIPEDFAYGLYNDDLERLEWYIEAACTRVPILAHGGVQKVINGPIPYAPDGYPYIGPAHGLKNFYNCNTFTFGICQGGGAGKSMAEWIIDGQPEWDLWSLDHRRYTSHANQKYSIAKAVELYQHEYAIPFPHEERPAGRPAKTTPVYAELANKGAQFGARAGWERATWFAQPGQETEGELTYGRPHFFDQVAKECEAVRERAGVLDLGGFTKYELSGPNAASWLDTMIAGDLPRLGRLTLSYFCTPTGGVWSEMTITRLSENHFYLISAGAAEWHDWDWLNDHMPTDGSVVLENVTARYGSLVLAGPRARDVLSKITESDLSNKAFPWLTCQEIEVGMARMRALRVNYVGELGWELHMPVEYQLPVYQALMEAGEEFGIADFGMYAMDSLRLEKCYRGWKTELDSEYSPLRSGLARFVNLDKPDFIGKEAMVAEKEAGLPDLFVSLLLDEGDCEAAYGSTIYQNGEVVGYVTSGGYGHTIKQSIALGYVRTDLAVEGTELTVDVFGEQRQATVGGDPIFDPKNERPRTP